MTSTLTSNLVNNPSALAAREALRRATTAPAAAPATSTGQIGKRIKEAPDNAAYWSIPGASSTDGADELAGALSGVAASAPGKFVEPDMDFEAAVLKARQTREQLAVQQLNIANAVNGPSVLTLFR